MNINIYSFLLINNIKMYHIIQCKSKNIHIPCLLSIFSSTVTKLPIGYVSLGSFNNKENAQDTIDEILLNNCQKYTRYLNKNGLPDQVDQVSEYTIIYIDKNITIDSGLYIVCLYDYMIILF